FFVISAITVFLVACSSDTVSAASSGIPLNIPINTASAPSSSAPAETPTNTASAAGGGMQAEPTEMQQGLPKNDNITGVRGAINVDLPANIPANPSVNYAWGGHMCEAGGSLYYVSDGGKGEDSPVHIARMNADKSQGIAVTGEYEYIYGLTADENNLYFMAPTSQGIYDALYALPLNGGGEKKIKTRDWTYGYPQAAGGKLYWESDSDPVSKDNVVNIMCMNPDGTDEKQLLSIPLGYSDYFHFLATSNGLYYSCPTSTDNDDCALFHTDQQGQNKVQLNKQNLGRVDMLFYDQNNIYFLTLNFDNNDYAIVSRMDANGQTSVIIKHIDYIDYFCGVSENILYYFNYGDSDGMDLRSYNMINKKDKIIANVEMQTPSILHSIRGKTIDTLSSQGFFIVGNDLYYSFHRTP
ncbi:MAG: hypothetical protein WCP73_08740, partial [Eubacteriales bacterium]